MYMLQWLVSGGRASRASVVSRVRLARRPGEVVLGRVRLKWVMGASEVTNGIKSGSDA
jgi:hypothetical protein